MLHILKIIEKISYMIWASIILRNILYICVISWLLLILFVDEDNLYYNFIGDRFLFPIFVIALMWKLSSLGIYLSAKVYREKTSDDSEDLFDRYWYKPWYIIFIIVSILISLYYTAFIVELSLEEYNKHMYKITKDIEYLTLDSGERLPVSFIKWIFAFMK
jgi:hypothetical protein